MALRVPEQHIENVRKLLDIPDDKVQEFLDALAQAGPLFNVYDLATEVSKRTGLSEHLTQGVMQVINGLYIASERQAIPINTLVDSAMLAIRTALALPPDSAEAKLALLSNFLKTALSLDNTVGTASKAGRVLTAHERIFVDARVLTDIRPIFHADLSDKPTAAVLIHMLCITERDNFQNKNAVYVALDANDLRSLRGMIDRAIKKEDTIKTLMAPDMTILTPKEIY